jgi:hypothetical protein
MKRPIAVTLALPTNASPRRFDGTLPIVFLSRKAAEAWLGWHNRAASWHLVTTTTWDGLDTEAFVAEVAARVR